MNRELSYSEVQDYLEKYSTQAPPYDFNGLLQLVLAGVENLRRNSSDPKLLDQDLRDYAHTLSADQAQFLRRLLDARAQSIAENPLPEP